MDGQIFAQISDITAQIPDKACGDIGISGYDRRWSGVIGTNGSLKGTFSDDDRVLEHKVSSIWCGQPAVVKKQAGNPWQLIYQHDTDGSPMQGSKTALLDAIRTGADIKIAWCVSVKDGEITVEHTAVPGFVSIVANQHVAVHLPEHIAQASYVQPGSLRFGDPQVIWHGMMTSEGKFDAIWYHRGRGEILQHKLQRVRLSWLMRRDSLGQATASLATPGGVVLEK